MSAVSCNNTNTLSNTGLRVLSNQEVDIVSGGFFAEAFGWYLAFGGFGGGIGVGLAYYLSRPK